MNKDQVISLIDIIFNEKIRKEIKIISINIIVKQVIKGLAINIYPKGFIYYQRCTP